MLRLLKDFFFFFQMMVPSFGIKSNVLYHASVHGLYTINCLEISIILARSKYLDNFFVASNINGDSDAYRLIC